jgi:hypothetical protein
MQTLSVQVEDSYMQQFMHFVNNSQSHIIVKNDEKLDLDPHFYERRKELHQIRDDIKNGKMEMLSQEQYDQEIEEFFKHIENES